MGEWKNFITEVLPMNKCFLAIVLEREENSSGGSRGGGGGARGPGPLSLPPISIPIIWGGYLICTNKAHAS